MLCAYAIRATRSHEFRARIEPGQVGQPINQPANEFASCVISAWRCCCQCCLCRSFYVFFKIILLLHSLSIGKILIFLLNNFIYSGIVLSPSLAFNFIYVHIGEHICTRIDIQHILIIMCMCVALYGIIKFGFFRFAPCVFQQPAHTGFITFQPLPPHVSTLWQCAFSQQQSIFVVTRFILFFLVSFGFFFTNLSQYIYRSCPFNIDKYSTIQFTCAPQIIWKTYSTQIKFTHSTSIALRMVMSFQSIQSNQQVCDNRSIYHMHQTENSACFDFFLFRLINFWCSRNVRPSFTSLYKYICTVIVLPH